MKWPLANKQSVILIFHCFFNSFTKTSCWATTCCIFNFSRKNVIRSTCRQTAISWSVGLLTLYKRPFFVTINCANAVLVLDPLAAPLFHSLSTVLRRKTQIGAERNGRLEMTTNIYYFIILLVFSFTLICWNQRAFLGVCVNQCPRLSRKKNIDGTRYAVAKLSSSVDQ